MYRSSGNLSQDRHDLLHLLKTTNAISLETLTPSQQHILDMEVLRGEADILETKSGQAFYVKVNETRPKLFTLERKGKFGQKYAFEKSYCCNAKLELIRTANKARCGKHYITVQEGVRCICCKQETLYAHYRGRRL